MMALAAYLFYTAAPGALFAAGFLIGLVAMRLYDNQWERIWRVPLCTPGNCFCRTTCACILMAPVK